MDIQQLKLLAGRTRDLLEQKNHSIGHSVSLDLVAALPGLRNWPEVLAFPDRVASCELEASTAARLAFRLKKNYSVDIATQALVDALSHSKAAGQTPAPQIWPAGPAPGVYITTSQAAIDALLERYEDATDGALVYAERAGNHWAGSIDLGDGGLWSNGLKRVPSGTLLIVGPLEINQQAWSESSGHLEMACLRAQGSGHRVAVLVKSPTPESICEDVMLMVESLQVDGGDCHAALAGTVAEDGELQLREPFARRRAAPTFVSAIASLEPIPQPALKLLRQALAQRTAGLLLFGSGVIKDHPAADLLAAALTLTEDAGPAARIMPRTRSTPAKDWMVPDAIAQLPYLPSIESAYAQGYRRLIFDPGYTTCDLLVEFAEDVLLIAGTWGQSVEDIFMSMNRAGGAKDYCELLPKLVAILGVTQVPAKQGNAVIADMFIPSSNDAAQILKFDDIDQHLKNNRVIAWETELEQLLDAGRVTATAVKKALPRNHNVGNFLSARSKSLRLATSG